MYKYVYIYSDVIMIIIMFSLSIFYLPKKGTCDFTSYNGLIASISAFVKTGFAIFGPFPGMISKSTPIAGSGVKMSTFQLKYVTYNNKAGTLSFKDRYIH